MKYCPITTSTHPVVLLYNSCLEDINRLITNEGYIGTTPLYTKNEIVINLDKIERKIASLERRSPIKSMDMGVGIRSSDLSTINILLVELRFNYTHMKNLTKKELYGKVAGSLLALGKSVPIYKDYIFVFQSNLKAQARSRFFRMDPKIDTNYIVMDILELKTEFFD